MVAAGLRGMMGAMSRRRVIVGVLFVDAALWAGIVMAVRLLARVVS